jgi:hypothetical protein
MKLEYAGDFYTRSIYNKEAVPWRVVECRDYVVAAMGTGFSGAWSGLNFNIGESVVRTAVAFLCESQEFSASGFQAVYSRVQQMLRDDFPYDCESQEVVYDCAASSLFIVVIKGRQVFAAWKGDEEAFHIRDGRIIARTIGHSLKSMIQKENPGVEVNPEYDLIFQPLSADSDNPAPEILPNPWQLQSGDSILITTRRTFQRVSESSLPEYLMGKSAVEAVQALLKDASIEPLQLIGMAVIVIRAIED